MRKSYLFIIMFALLAVSQMAAQDYDYIPFVREGVKWVCMYRSPYDENVAGLPISKGDHYYTLELKGDSVINGHTYKAMHLYSGESINVDQDTVPVYLREENKVVYAIIPDDKRYAECPVGIECMVTDQKFSSPVQTGVEYILYDFNNPELFYAYADCYDYTDTVMIAGKPRKRHVFNTDDVTKAEKDYIVEGIGYAGNSPGSTLNYFYPQISGLQMIYHISRVIENGEVVFSNGQFGPQEYQAGYVPFVREGVKWVYGINNYNYDACGNPAQGDGLTFRTLELKGDKVINGKTYKAMHKYSGGAINEMNDTIPVYLREEDKMVYGIIPDKMVYDDCPVGDYHHAADPYSGEEFLLYDFNDPQSHWTPWIAFDDSIAVGSNWLKRYNFQNGSDPVFSAFSVIEGIGLDAPSSTPICFFMPMEAGANGTCFHLSHVIQDDRIIYRSPEYYTADRYLPIIREGVKWVNEKVVVCQGDTTRYYYTYEFMGEDPAKNGCQSFKALYYYTGRDLNAANDSLIAGMRESEAIVVSNRNHALDRVMLKGDNMIDFYNNNGNNVLYELSTDIDWGEMSIIDYYLQYQGSSFLNRSNLVRTVPIEIDGVLCSRIAYVGEQGDTLAYVVEGIGFDSRDMGDLLTPFTRKPDPSADYQEWCGLSHVVRDGQIIYKGMRYRDGALDGIDEVVADKSPRSLDDNYYNLMGQPVGKDLPTLPGIYIHHGNKILVR